MTKKEKNLTIKLLEILLLEKISDRSKLNAEIMQVTETIRMVKDKSPSK